MSNYGFIDNIRLDSLALSDFECCRWTKDVMKSMLVNVKGQQVEPEGGHIRMLKWNKRQEKQQNCNNFVF